MLGFERVTIPADAPAPVRGSIVTTSLDAAGDLCAVGPAFATGAWPVASLSILVPFEVGSTVTVKQLGWVVGTSAASVNLDSGIYDLAGTLLVSTGTTPLSGSSNVIQLVDITDYLLPRGTYYLALASDATGSGTSIIGRSAPGIQWLEAAGVKQVAANFPLATGATFAAPGNAYLPRIVLDLSGVL